MAMKLLFSRINEERKCHNFITARCACLAGKREGVHFVPNPFDWGQKWDLWSDLQWIPHWTHLFGAFGRLWMRGPSCRELKISKWQSPFSDKFMFLLDWMFFRMKVVTICLTNCCLFNYTDISILGRKFNPNTITMLAFLTIKDLLKILWLLSF